ncbi:TPR repeat family protein [Rickettsia hoogstraalii str. RCCE3]|nr:TPR repeat family protein [Rickettsia hoogstraalii str. RCCE3]
MKKQLKNYNLAIKYQPNCVEAYYNKAISLNILKKHHEAIENCDLAIEYDPKLYSIILRKRSIF